MAYDFCGPRYTRVTPDGGRQFVFAVKGSHGAGEIWPRKPSKITTKVPLWPIRVDPAKDQIYGRLSIAEPGPGYMHFHDGLEIKFFEGLTAEKVTERLTRRGFVERYWELKVAGSRNEPLDCCGYAVAALCGLRANGFDLESAVSDLVSRGAFVPPGRGGVAQAPAPDTVRRQRPSENVLDRGAQSWLGNTRDWLRR